MREIKFRVWDREKKEWALGYKEAGGFHLFGELHVLGYLRLGKLNDYVAMQFTGLKDKNGKEIYEGDITRVHYGYPESEEYEGVVKDIRTDCNFEEDAVQEVIGNIYENPELLGAGKK